jgi:two-component system phosphate regulon sensor histidine kinase PhoR
MAVKLSRLDELKDDFVNAVSHDLRNPLAAIDMAIAQLLEGASGTLTPSQITVLGSIRRSSRRLTEMVNNVLDVAKMKSGAMGLTIEPVDVEAIVRELVQLYATAAAQKKITLRVDVDPELPLLDLDEEKVHRIFLNLLNNALKFTLSGGEITLGLKAGKDGMDCSVADTGIGISAQDLPRIFERFITADGDDPAAKHHHGTGLGLTIVREFIDLLGAGPIHVESERGRGTTFRWTFRSVEAPPQAADKS